MTDLPVRQDAPHRVLIVDDHGLVREGLRVFLSEEPDIDVVGEASDGRDAVALAAALRPDVILMDLMMPNLGGIEATRLIGDVSPESRVLILTSFAEDQQVQDAIAAGASGYLLKDVLQEDLLRAIRDAARGRPTLHPDVQRRLMQRVAAPDPPGPLDELTSRERDVLALLGRGRSNKEIAAALSLTDGTVKGYVSAIFAKLGVADRTQAALLAVKHGLASGDL